MSPSPREQPRQFQSVPFHSPLRTRPLHPWFTARLPTEHPSKASLKRASYRALSNLTVKKAARVGFCPRVSCLRTTSHPGHSHLLPSISSYCDRHCESLTKTCPGTTQAGLEHIPLIPLILSSHTPTRSSAALPTCLYQTETPRRLPATTKTLRKAYYSKGSGNLSPLLGSLRVMGLSNMLARPSTRT